MIHLKLKVLKCLYNVISHIWFSITTRDITKYMLYVIYYEILYWVERL